MDKVYLADIPKYKQALMELKRDFAGVACSTDWTELRIKPLLAHVNALDRVLKSPQFAPEVSRLRKGVAMFHADLIYLRKNIDELRTILEHKKKTQTRRSGPTPG